VASCQTAAVRRGEDLVINGQKMWITNAFQAGLEKTGFKKKTQPSVFFVFFVSLVFFYIVAQKREILGFFQLQEYGI
jgi:hypothetical protein